MKKWNQKSKAEQIFLLCLLFVFAFGLLCVTGCDGCDCETVQCGSEELEGGSATAVSIPGCGGCISSGKGCNSCLWAQSTKLACSSQSGEEDGDEVKMNINGCDTRYYGGDCMGCDQEEKSCYSGCMTGEDTDEEAAYNSVDVIFCGSYLGPYDDENSAHAIGCVDGCFRCVEYSDIGIEHLLNIEWLTGVD